MKLKTIFPIILLLFSFNIYAQGGRMREKKEEIKTLKVAFLTTELSLSSSEAERFWPVYNSFEDKQFELRHQKIKSGLNRMNDGAIEKLSEKEAAVLLAQIESNEEELFQLRKKLILNLKNVISSVKILKLKKAEDDFNKKLLQQYRDKAQRR